MILKIKPIRSKALRDSARGESCTFEIPGFCNSDPETTVGCHLQWEGGAMGSKADDISLAYGCSGCHEAIDSRRIDAIDRQFYSIRAMVRTQRRMYGKGLLSIKGAA